MFLRFCACFAQAVATSERFAAALGCDPATQGANLLKCLRALPTGKVMGAHAPGVWQNVDAAWHAVALETELEGAIVLFLTKIQLIDDDCSFGSCSVVNGD